MDKAQRASALEAAYELLGTPRSHLRVKLEQTEDAVLLRYQDQTLTGVQLDESGINAAAAMAVALGVNVPPTGEASEVLASTGLLHRVLAISDLDFSNPTAFELANVLVNESIDMQRGSRARFEAAPMDLDELEPGQAFGPYVIEISQPDADAYIAATGDIDDPHDFAGNMHPLQLDAYVLSRLISEIGIVQNRIETVHAGQQMTVHRQATPGEMIIANSTLKSCSNRRGSVWAIFESTFTDETGRRVAESSSTIIMMP